MMENPQISVIVPVYKAENYLHKCVDSLLAQTFTNFEIILVDDGSPDRSGEICDEYAKKDSRIKVIHKENGGVSSARQCGIDNARGEYTIHADPDDWVENNMLEELYRKAKEDDADMVICDFYIENENKTTYIKQKPISLNYKAMICELFQQLHGSCWNKLIRRTCYVDNDVKFPLDFSYCEDLIFNIRLIKNDIKIAYLPLAFYHYEQNVNVNSLVMNRSVETNIKLFQLFHAELPSDIFHKVAPYLAYSIVLHACNSSQCSSRTFRSKFRYYARIAIRAHKRIFLIRLSLLFAAYVTYRPIQNILKLPK